MNIPGRENYNDRSRNRMWKATLTMGNELNTQDMHMGSNEYHTGLYNVELKDVSLKYSYW